MLLRRYFQAAARHGSDSDPDHEIGDLQALLSRVWDLVPEYKRDEIAADFADYFETWGVS